MCLSLSSRAASTSHANAAERLTAIGSDLKPLLPLCSNTDSIRVLLPLPPPYVRQGRLRVRRPRQSRNLPENSASPSLLPNLIHIDYGVCLSLSLSAPHPEPILSNHSICCPRAAEGETTKDWKEDEERLFHLHESIFQKSHRVTAAIARRQS